MKTLNKVRKLQKVENNKLNLLLSFTKNPIEVLTKVAVYVLAWLNGYHSKVSVGITQYFWSEFKKSVCLVIQTVSVYKNIYTRSLENTELIEASFEPRLSTGWNENVPIRKTEVIFVKLTKKILRIFSCLNFFNT